MATGADAATGALAGFVRGPDPKEEGIQATIGRLRSRSLVVGWTDRSHLGCHEVPAARAASRPYLVRVEITLKDHFSIFPVTADRAGTSRADPGFFLAS